jgi:hypothetical protein
VAPVVDVVAGPIGTGGSARVGPRSLGARRRAIVGRRPIGVAQRRVGGAGLVRSAQVEARVAGAAARIARAGAADGAAVGVLHRALRGVGDAAIGRGAHAADLTAALLGGRLGQWPPGLVSGSAHAVSPGR